MACQLSREDRYCNSDKSEDGSRVGRIASDKSSSNISNRADTTNAISKTSQTI
jgi:hypothetical protein